jgi:hypothetical protein
MPRPRKIVKAATVNAANQPPLPSIEAISSDSSKVQVALQISPQARQFLNLMASLEGSSQAEIVEELIKDKARAYDFQARVARMLQL